MSKVRVLHCITSLHSDGAQNMLLKISQHREASDYLILSLLDMGVLGEKLEAEGCRVLTLEMKSPLLFLKKLRSVSQEIKKFSPDVIQGWMYHGNLATSLLNKLLFNSEKKAVLWNIRRGLSHSDTDKLLTKAIISLGAKLSKIPSGIVYCGKRLAEEHEAVGYSSQRRIVIPNGFDCDKFSLSTHHRLEKRTELGIPLGTPLIGMVGRYHPQKDHHTFVETASRVLKKHPECKFILIGRGLDSENEELDSMLSSLNIRNQFLLLGERSDVPQLLSAIDIFCLSSRCEGFPNVLGEAMAASCLVATTDAGVAAEVVGEEALVAPVEDPDSLSHIVINLLETPQIKADSMREEGRKRVITNFKIQKVSSTYEQLYFKISGRELQNIASASAANESPRTRAAESR